MNKVGIFTVPISRNIGCCLQTWALQQVIKNFGAVPETISVIQDYYNKPDFLPSFVKENINIRFIRNTNELKEKDYDFLISGSDQIWRYGITRDRLFLDEFLHFAKEWNIPKISYAASFGNNDLRIPNYLLNEVEDLLFKYNSISIREKNGVEKLKLDFNYRDAKYVCDPTLLVPKEEYEKLCSNFPVAEPKPFIYTVNNRGNDFNLNTIIEKLKLTDYSYMNAAVSIKEEISVEEWIANIRDCSYIITDSYHAAIFALIFNKPFIVCCSKFSPHRFEIFKEISSINKEFNIIYDINELTPEKIFNNTDYNKLNLIIKDSYEWLKNNFLNPPIKPQNNFKAQCYAAQNTNIDILKKSSSGGVFYSFAKKVIDSGGIVFGAAWDKNWLVEMKYVDNLNDIHQLMGSKYVMANIKNTYKECEDFLKSGKKVLYSGIGCQLFGLKKFLKKDYDNLYLLEIACEGTVPVSSWKEYLSSLEKENTNITSIKMRSKEKMNWRNSYDFNVEYSDGIILNEHHTNNFWIRKIFDNNNLKLSCLNCKFKNTISDFVIGDFWNYNRCIGNINETYGISFMIVKNEKAKSFLDEIEDLILEKTNLSLIQPNQGITNRLKEYTEKM